MPSTRRSVLTAAVALAGGCTGLPTRSDPADENGTDTPNPSGSDADPAFAEWSRGIPHDDIGLLSLGGGPETPAVFVGSGGAEDESADGDHTLHALSLQDGSEKWRADVPNPVQSAPRYAGSPDAPRITFATGRESLHGREFEILAVDHESGEESWRFDVEDRRFLSPLVTTEETVFVGRRDDQLAENGEYVYALDAADGDERWEAETGDAARAGHARRRDTLFVKTSRGVSAFDTGEGEERWRADADSVGYDNRGERVFVETDGAVGALSVSDGSELWRREFDFTISRVTTPREAMDETVFVGDYGGRLLALSPLDGETRWTLPVEGDQFRPSVERTSDRLYVAGAGVHAVDPVSGEREWSFAPGVEGYVHVDASTTVFARTDRRLWALDPETGEERWQFAPGGEFAGVANAGDLAFVAVDGTAYGLDGSAIAAQGDA